VPLSEAEEPLDRLLVVEGLVIGGVLLALTLGATLIVRVGLRPLDRIGETAGAIAGGDLSSRVEPAEERTEVGRLGLAERDARATRGGLRWRADPGRGRGRAGAGLGLSIVAAIVSAHGGRAEAADAEGGGVRFKVTLPASVRDERSGSRGAAGVPLVGDE